MEYGVEIETIGYDSIRTDSAEMGHGDGMRLSVFAIVFTRTAQPRIARTFLCGLLASLLMVSLPVKRCSRINQHCIDKWRAKSIFDTLINDGIAMDVLYVC